MSEQIEDHLAFRLDGRVILYKVRLSRPLPKLYCRVCTVHVFSITDRGHGMHEFGVEFWKTCLLLFARNELSLRVGARLGVNMSLLRACRDHIYPDNVSLQLEDFPFRFANLIEINTPMTPWLLHLIIEIWRDI